MSQIISLQNGIACSRDESKHPDQWDGLVASWPMIEGGGTTAFDWSGRGKHGAAIGNLAWAVSRSGTQLTLDGVDDCIDWGNDQSLQPAKALTACFWFEPISSGDGFDKALLSCFKESAPRGGFGFYRSSSTSKLDCYVGLSTGAGYLVATTTTATTNGGLWFVGMTYESGGSVRTFVNGKQESVSAGTGGDIIYQGTDLKFGLRTSLTKYTNTHVQDVRVYDYAWSEDEFLAAYHRGPNAHLIRRRRRSAFAIQLVAKKLLMRRRRMSV